MHKPRKTALMTGITGFVGSHLAELLLREGVSVHGLTRFRSSTENIDAIKDRLHLLEGDLADAHSDPTACAPRLLTGNARGHPSRTPLSLSRLLRSASGRGLEGGRAPLPGAWGCSPRFDF